MRTDSLIFPRIEKNLIKVLIISSKVLVITLVDIHSTYLSEIWQEVATIFE